ncbi:MAG TPA: phosphate-starvation-inducible PsiE family protein [Ktedonobacteraceae bacterium]|nr:phosphate-starvation-inducible PsiE family protein [Ktedonobacteraceae bacterium]
MSDHQTTNNEKSGLTSMFSPNPSDEPKNHDDDNDPIAAFSSKLLDRSDSLVYAIVGVCFFLSGLFALGYSFWQFGETILNVSGIVAQATVAHNPTTAQEVVASAIIQLISDLLLVLIIMEVLGTVVHYLKSHITSLHPFLFIGIISATRGILSIGARLSVEGTSVPSQEFTRSMIELGVNAAVILALGITLKLLGRQTTN